MRSYFTGKLICAFSFYMFCITWCPAQGPATDTAFLGRAKAAAFTQYSARIAEQSPLDNGSEYKEYLLVPELTTGIPYFLSDDWQDGNVHYDSGLYSNVPLLYDEVTDKLIVEQPFSHFKLELISEKIKYFQIAGHTFVRIVRAKSDSALVTGFYEQLYDGKTKAFVRHYKEMKETAQVGGVTKEFLDHSTFLIQKGNVFYKVGKKRSVLKVFEDRKKALAKLVRAHSREIDFRKNRGRSIALISRLYDETAN
jgi:hypothetical protein